MVTGNGDWKENRLRGGRQHEGPVGGFGGFGGFTQPDRENCHKTQKSNVECQ